MSSTEQNKAENKMGVLPVKKLLVTMSLPMIVAMLVQALYNIVDSAFVGKYSDNALTAITLAFPIQNLMIAVAAGTGVGINALLSRNLGEKKFKEANLAANNGILLGIASSIAFAIFGFFFSNYFFRAQFSAQEMLADPINCQEIIDYGTTYLSICTIFSIGIFLSIILERLLQATGNTTYTLFTQGLGAVINIILDPILIFGLAGFPKLGVAGAAIATVIGQIAGMLLAIYFNVKRNKEITVGIKHLKFHPHTVKAIYSVGFPSIIMQSISSVMTFGMNNILMGFSATAVNVFGIYFKLQSFVFMPVFGLTNGFIPIIAYNYGARNSKRIMDTFRFAMKLVVSFMVLGFAAFQLFPELLLSIFNNSDEMMRIGIPALRIISFNFLLAGFSIIMISMLQALGNGVSSMIISIVRQLLVLLPAAYLLAKIFHVNAVWFAFPIAELVAVVMCIVFFMKVYKDKIKTLA